MPLTGGTELLNPHTLLERVGLRASMHVADLGCGVTGHFIVPAARVGGAEGKAYAVDIQKSALAATESRAKLDGITNITSVWADIERLGLGQLIALRFASDAELPALIDEVLAQGIRSRDEIKEKVKDWQADWMRV